MSDHRGNSVVLLQENSSKPGALEGCWTAAAFHAAKVPCGLHLPSTEPPLRWDTGCRGISKYSSPVSSF